MGETLTQLLYLNFMFAEFPYKYIVFRQTSLNFMLLAGWAMQFPMALERGLYQPIMYFKKTKRLNHKCF